MHNHNNNHNHNNHHNYHSNNHNNNSNSNNDVVGWWDGCCFLLALAPSSPLNHL